MDRQDLKPAAPYQLLLTMAGPYRISTIDQSKIPGLEGFFARPGAGPPFETMVFGGEGSSDLDCDKYATEEQARAGHEAMVATWLAREDAPAAGRSVVLVQTVSRNLEFPICGDVCALGEERYVCTQSDFTNPEAPVLRFVKSTAPRHPAEEAT